MEPIFVVACNEPDGVIERSVYPFTLTDEAAVKFYNQAKKFPKIFNKIPTDTIDGFLDSFFKWDPIRHEASAEGLFWVVDDFVGVFSLTNIYHPDDALMHFTFFDQRIRGRGPLVKRMIKYVFDTYCFHRLSAEIPATASKVVFKFLNKDVGLAIEGRKHKAIEYNNDRADLILYGAYPEDFNGRLEN